MFTALKLVGSTSRLAAGALLGSLLMISVSPGGPVLTPIDASATIAPEEFTVAGEDVWMTDSVKAPFKFDELIYSWQIKISENEGFRLYIQVSFDNGDESPWLYAGYWGDVPTVTEKRENPAFDDGYIAMDQLLMEKKACRWQFKLESKGEKSLTVFPELTVITTDNHPTEELVKEFGWMPSGEYVAPKLLKLPFRAQASSEGEYLPDRCQSAAVDSTSFDCLTPTTTRGSRFANSAPRSSTR